MIFAGIEGTETTEGVIDGSQRTDDTNGVAELSGVTSSSDSAQAAAEGTGAASGEAIQESTTETAREVQPEVSGVATTKGTNEITSEETKAEVTNRDSFEFLEWRDWDEKAERTKDEEAYKAVIAGLERQITDTVQDEESLKASIKATREYRKELLDKYTQKKIAGVEYSKRPEKPVASVNKDGDSSAAPAPQQSVGSDDESWRDIPLAGVIRGIKGLGEKKIDALCHEAPTLGAFEDLRGEASKAFKQFKDVLPKGFGEQLTSDLEEAVWAAIKKHQSGPIVLTIATGTTSEETTETIATGVEAPIETEPTSELIYEDVDDDTVSDEELIVDDAHEWEEDFSDNDLLEPHDDRDLLSEL